MTFDELYESRMNVSTEELHENGKVQSDLDALDTVLKKLEGADYEAMKVVDKIKRSYGLGKRLKYNDNMSTYNYVDNIKRELMDYYMANP